MNDTVMNYPSGWFAILHKSDIKYNKPIAIYRFGINLVAWYDGNASVVVMEDRCPHRCAKLSLGKICQGKIVCPFHGFQFSSNGSCEFAPEFGRSIPKLKVKTYRALIKCDMVWIFWGDDYVSDLDIGILDQIHTDFNSKYSMFTKSWNANITRCIENQLDYTHLPNVHHNTIGKNFVIPENPFFEMKNNCIYSSHSNKQNTTIANSIFIFPNAWILNISSKFKLIVYFVPLDNHRTKLYLLSYRKFLNNRIIKKMIDIPVNFYNQIILKQDQKIVESQTMDFNSSDELLMKHDGAIRLFRNLWHKN